MSGWIVFLVILLVIVIAIIIGVAVYFARRKSNPGIIGLCTTPLSFSGSNNLSIVSSTDLRTVTVKTIGSLKGYQTNQPITSTTTLTRSSDQKSVITKSFTINSDNTVSSTLDTSSLSLKNGDTITVTLVMSNACNKNNGATATNSKIIT